MLRLLKQIENNSFSSETKKYIYIIYMQSYVNHSSDFFKIHFWRIEKHWITLACFIPHLHLTLQSFPFLLQDLDIAT